VTEADDPRNWRLDIARDRIELYLELSDQPRALSADEAAKMVELVNAWRAHEHRKHIALMHARDKDTPQNMRARAAAGARLPNASAPTT
jgi:hypothetical protein